MMLQRFSVFGMALICSACDGTPSNAGGSTGGGASGGAAATVSTVARGVVTGPQIALTLEPSLLSKKYRAAHQNLNYPVFPIDVSLSQQITGNVVLRLMADQPILSQDPVSVSANDRGGYRANIALNADLAVGTYHGMLRFELCQDSTCQWLYNLTGNEIPYEVDVLPAVALTVTTGGTTVAVPVTNDGIITVAATVRSGARVHVEASEAAFISENQSGVRVDEVVRADSSWEGTLVYASSTHGDVCHLTLAATTAASPQGETEVIVAVTE